MTCYTQSHCSEGTPLAASNLISDILSNKISYHILKCSNWNRNKMPWLFTRITVVSMGGWYCCLQIRFIALTQLLSRENIFHLYLESEIVCLKNSRCALIWPPTPRQQSLSTHTIWRIPEIYLFLRYFWWYYVYVISKKVICWMIS